MPSLKITQRGIFSASLGLTVPVRDHVGVGAGCCDVRQKAELPGLQGTLVLSAKIM